MDRLVSMRVFAKVVEQGSFARAATALEMSATVVTRNVADLEAHLGTRLLNRTTRRLSLTETGQQYLERVRQILADIDDADAIASSSSRKPSGTLRIYCHPGFGQSQLAVLLPRMRRRCPTWCSTSRWPTMRSTWSSRASTSASSSACRSSTPA